MLLFVSICCRFKKHACNTASPCSYSSVFDNMIEYPARFIVVLGNEDPTY